jgi:hypothetical protein
LERRKGGETSKHGLYNLLGEEGGEKSLLKLTYSRYILAGRVEGGESRTGLHSTLERRKRQQKSYKLISILPWRAGEKRQVL